MRTSLVGTCKCKPNEIKELEKSHINTFMILFNAQNIVQKLQEMINKAYYGHGLEKA